MEEKRFLGQFLGECLLLYDLSPSVACSIIYGSWPGSHPDIKVSSHTFKGENYLRYSEAARKEVISALVMYENKSILSNIIIGLIDTPDFLKELDLWKNWGVDAGFIRNELDEYLSVKIYHYSWLNAKLFSEIADYIGLELPAQEASDWMTGMKRKHGLTPEIQLVFEKSIKKHTI